MEQPPRDRTVVESDPRRTGPAGLLGSRGLLVVVSRRLFGTTAAIARPSTTVGRQDDCDFVLRDPLMSRRHFRLAVEDGEFTIEDLGSTNGTLLNARRLQGKSRILYGDRIVAGGSILRFLVEEDVEKKRAIGRRTAYRSDK